VKILSRLEYQLQWVEPIGACCIAFAMYALRGKVALLFSIARTSVDQIVQTFLRLFGDCVFNEQSWVEENVLRSICCRFCVLLVGAAPQRCAKVDGEGLVSSVPTRKN
jgi:hypothetical protein